MSNIRFKKMQASAKIPSRKHKTDAGLDLYALEDVIIRPGDQKVVHTGIKLAYAPENTVLQIWPKSGLSSKYGLQTGAGIVDSGYRGELLVLIQYWPGSNANALQLEAGEAIAQIVPVSLAPVDIEVGECKQSDRGAEGGILRTEEANAHKKN